MRAISSQGHRSVATGYQTAMPTPGAMYSNGGNTTVTSGIIYGSQAQPRKRGQSSTVYNSKNLYRNAYQKTTSNQFINH